MQIDSVELLLVSFSFVLTLYGINSSRRGSNTVLCTIAFQEPSDSAHGELSSGIKQLCFPQKYRAENLVKLRGWISLLIKFPTLHPAVAELVLSVYFNHVAVVRENCFRARNRRYCHLFGT